MTERNATAVAVEPDPPLEVLLELLSSTGLPTEDVEPDRAGQRYFGVRRKGRWVAVIGLERLDACGLLRSLAVTPQARRMGLGGALVAHVMATASANGLGVLYLLTNDAAGYFERLGFAPVRRDDVPASVRCHAQFQALCPATAVVLSRALN